MLHLKVCVFFSFHELMKFIHSSKKFRIKLVPQILHLKFLLFSCTEAICSFKNHFLWKTSIAKVSLEGLFWFMNRRNMFFYFGIFAKLASQFLYLRSLIILWNDATCVFMLLFSAKLASHFFICLLCVQVLVNNDGQMTNTIFLSNWREHSSQNRALKNVKMSLFVFFK